MKTLAVRGLVWDVQGSDATYVRIPQYGQLRSNVLPKEVDSRGDLPTGVTPCCGAASAGGPSRSLVAGHPGLASVPVGFPAANARVLLSVQESGPIDGQNGGTTCESSGCP